MAPPKTRAVISTDVLSVSIFKYLQERIGFLLESLETLIGLAPWGLFHQGFVPFFFVSSSSFSILFFKKGKEEKKTELKKEGNGGREGKKEEREREGRKEKKENQPLLYTLRDFHFISDLKDGFSNHLVL